MAQRLGVVMAREGAIARQHMATLRRVEGVEVVAVAGGDATGTAKFTAGLGSPRQGLDLGAMLDEPEADAVVWPARRRSTPRRRPR